MSLTEEFNDDYEVRLLNSALLQVKHATSGGNTYLIYDFNARLMTARTGSNEGGVSVLTFAQLDPDSLQAMRNKLVALGGKPPALPGNEVALPKPRSGQLNA